MKKRKRGENFGIQLCFGFNETLYFVFSSLFSRWEGKADVIARLKDLDPSSYLPSIRV